MSDLGGTNWHIDTPLGILEQFLQPWRRNQNTHTHTQTESFPSEIPHPGAFLPWGIHRCTSWLRGDLASINGHGEGLRCLEYQPSEGAPGFCCLQTHVLPRRLLTVRKADGQTKTMSDSTGKTAAKEKNIIAAAFFWGWVLTCGSCCISWSSVCAALGRQQLLWNRRLLRGAAGSTEAGGKASGILGESLISALSSPG